MPLRYLTAGESHGPALTAIVEGLPAGVALSAAQINEHLRRRQLGYGRGRRMQIETDEVEILSGVRHGVSLGGPVTFMIRNKDWPRWERAMAVEAPDDPDEVRAAAEKDWRLRPVSRPRPGHADWPGALKYGFTDARNILERASARETAMRVAAGAAAAALLREFGIGIGSHVVRLGPAAAELDKDAPAPSPADLARVDESPVRCLDPAASAAMVSAVDEAKAKGETLGGVFEVIAWGVPPGLGSHVQWDRKLDACSGRGGHEHSSHQGGGIRHRFRSRSPRGLRSHDAIHVDEEGRVYRPTNRAGGIEGGMSNGQPIVVRAAMKPLATLYDPMPSIDMLTREASKGAIERSDVTAVPAAAVVAEAVVAFELARAMIEKFGGDSLAEMRRNYDAYVADLAGRGVQLERSGSS